MHMIPEQQQQQRREEDEDAVCDGTSPQVSNLHFLRRYPDIRIEGENYLPIPLYRHIASFLSMFKLLVIGVIIIGKDPFALFGMQAPGIWEWGQGNKIYACMMVFFLSNMIENQLMSTGAFEITLNDVPVWSKLESDHTTPNPTLHILAGAKSPSMFEVGFSLGREVMFMKVCAEGRKTASTDWMPPSPFTMPF
ncbi:Thioredoxin reductase-like selenoprotein T1a [Larimichthys crocea]|uniref:Selenoprotein T n=1 Tax=Larimichthys crocea TaxID=215358 RepID=A0A6G0IHE7_LARCR|nr:Thioredoxin reductase-like selenoprotein T1a [Larimichthys crocea]